MNVRGGTYSPSAVIREQRSSICSAFINCRLYSCSRLIWTSKMVSGSTSAPWWCLIQVAKAVLLARLISISSAMTASSLAYVRIDFSSLRLVTHASEPLRRVNKLDNPGLHILSHRRGVTPLVLLLNFSGQISYHSRRVSALIISVCKAATPLME